MNNEGIKPTVKNKQERYEDPLYCSTCDGIAEMGIYTPESWCNHYKLWRKKYYNER